MSKMEGSHAFLLTPDFAYLNDSSFLTNYITPCKGVLLVRRIVCSDCQENLTFMEPEYLLSHTQNTTTSLYPQSDEFNPHPKPYSLRIHFHIVSPSMPRLFEWAFSLSNQSSMHISFCHQFKCPSHTQHFKTIYKFDTFKL